MKRKLIAAIACRNQGSRLYAKPLQNLDVQKGVRILDQIIDCLRTLPFIDDIVLGVSRDFENDMFKGIATEKNVKYILGDEHDVLSRLISCGELVDATDIFRVTSESPFLYFEPVESVWQEHVAENRDGSFYDQGIDGTGFEIISLKALQLAHEKGERRHRSEYCTLYLREHLDEFNIKKILAPDWLNRKDLRLTVDHPEDLAVCRYVYNTFKNDAPRFRLDKIVDYLDRNAFLKEMIAPFTEEGYATMNL